MTAMGSLCATFLYLFSIVGSLDAAERAVAQEPIWVIEAYLRAVYARDFAAAYPYISAEDRKVRDLNRYLQQRGPYSGFILEVARKLSGSLEITALQQQIAANRARAVIKYRVPDPKKLAPMVFHWNAYQLNSLSPQSRKDLIDHLEKQKRAGLLDMSEGTESFELVKEGNDWRIFLQWAAGVRIPLRLDVSKLAELDASLSRSEVVLQPNDLFEIHLNIKNRAKQAVTVRIGHLVEPGELADYLDVVECGFLRPVTIEAGKERKFSGTYMLRGSLPEGIRQLNLTYDFRALQ